MIEKQKKMKESNTAVADEERENLNKQFEDMKHKLKEKERAKEEKAKEQRL